MVAFKFQIFLIPAVLPASHCPVKSSHLKFRNLFLPFPLSIPPKFDCLSAGKREHMTVKGMCLYYLYGKVSGQKKNPCFSVLSFRRLRKDFTTVYFPEEYATICPRKASFGGLQTQHRMTYTKRLY